MWVAKTLLHILVIWGNSLISRLCADVGDDLIVVEFF